MQPPAKLPDSGWPAWETLGPPSASVEEVEPGGRIQLQEASTREGGWASCSLELGGKGLGRVASAACFLSWAAGGLEQLPGIPGRWLDGLGWWAQRPTEVPRPRGCRACGGAVSRLLRTTGQSPREGHPSSRARGSVIQWATEIALAGRSCAFPVSLVPCPIISQFTLHQISLHHRLENPIPFLLQVRFYTGH